jgi:hypothetical protein
MRQNHDADLTEKLSKGIFIACVVVSILGGTFLFGAFAFRDNIFPIPQLKVGYGMLRQSISGDNSGDLAQHLQPTRDQGDGVTINTAKADGALVFLSGFFDGENQIRLIRRDGTVVKSLR